MSEEKEAKKKELVKKAKSDIENNRGPRPMGYIFPKRIQQAMQGETPVIKSYRNIAPKEKIVGKYEHDGKEYDLYEKIDGSQYIKYDGANVDIRVFKRNEGIVPLFCPVCKKQMKANIDSKFFWLRGKCHVCVSKDETELRAKGLYEEYEEKLVLQNQLAFFNDAKQGLEEFIENVKPVNEYVNEDGTIEKWTNDDYEKVKEFFQKELDDVNNKLSEIEEKLKKLNIEKDDENKK